MTTVERIAADVAGDRHSGVARPEVSIVIVTHESAGFIERCLRAVAAAAGGLHGGCEVVLVDNLSTDGTVDLARAACPDLRLVVPRTRGGFARNVNLGLRIAHGRYLLLLNPDTALEPAALATLWRTLQRTPDAAAIGPRLEREDGVREASARSFPSLARTFAQSLLLDRLLPAVPLWRSDLGGDSTDDRAVDWLTGACLLVRREAIEGSARHPAAGPLDDRLFLFVEDTEWCWRLRTAGWRVLYTPRARVLHHKGSGHGFSENRYALNCRGHAYFFRKHRGALAAWTYQALLVPGLLLRAALALAAILARPARRAEHAARVRAYLRLATRVLMGRLEREPEVP